MSGDGILNMIVRDGFTEVMAIEQNSKGSKRMGHETFWGKLVSGRGKNKYKGLYKGSSYRVSQ